jgi:SH3-like domain-containing protein
MSDAPSSRGAFASLAAAAALVPGLAVTVSAAAMFFATAAHALEFRATTEAATIFYDGPSLKSHKLFVVGRDYPVEVVVSVEGWVKVRDINGAPLAWVEKKALGERRVVAVKVPVAEVLSSTDSNAKLVFKAEQNVLLDLLEPPNSGWVKVRHRDGQTGYISISQVWGV